MPPKTRLSLTAIFFCLLSLRLFFPAAAPAAVFAESPFPKHAAASMAEPGGAATPFLSEGQPAARPAPGMLTAMGQRGDREALGTPEPSRSEPARQAQTPADQTRQEPDGRAAGQSPPPDQRPFFEQMFSGSALGAAFFGYPFNGLGMADILVLGLLVFTGLKSFLLRQKYRDWRDSTDIPPGPPQDGPPGGDETNAPHGKAATREKLPGKVPPQGDRRRGSLTSWPSPSQKEDAAEAKEKTAGKPRIPSKWGGPPENGANNGPDSGSGNIPRPRDTTKQRAERMWAHLQGSPPARVPGSVAEGAQVPERFNVEDFLEGARVLYARLQTSWAAREVDDLTPFISPGMMQLLREQAARNPEPDHIEILLVNASLAGVVTQGQEERAEVSFSVLLRHAPEEEPEQTHEMWRFVRGPASGSMWRLDSIETVEKP